MLAFFCQSAPLPKFRAQRTAVFGWLFVKNMFALGMDVDHTFKAESFDLVISSALLHFAGNQQHFDAMLNSMWSALKPGGYFFCRLGSEIDIETLVRFIGNGRYILPDGSERFLVNQEMLQRLTKKLGGQLHEPIKTTNVQNMRAMTTWCVRK